MPFVTCRLLINSFMVFDLSFLQNRIFIFFFSFITKVAYSKHCRALCFFDLNFILGIILLSVLSVIVLWIPSLLIQFKITGVPGILFLTQ